MLVSRDDGTSVYMTDFHVVSRRPKLHEPRHYCRPYCQPSLLLVMDSNLALRIFRDLVGKAQVGKLLHEKVYRQDRDTAKIRHRAIPQFGRKSPRPSPCFTS